VLNNLGVALAITGNSEGIDCPQQALNIRREIGDRKGEAQAANNLADTYQRLLPHPAEPEEMPHPVKPEEMPHP